MLSKSKYQLDVYALRDLVADHVEEAVATLPTQSQIGHTVWWTAACTWNVRAKIYCLIIRSIERQENCTPVQARGIFADLLGVSDRTVQRWLVEEPLPATPSVELLEKMRDGARAGE